MSFWDVSLPACVLIVTAWLGHDTAPRARLALWLTALLIAAGLFLPMELLRGAMPPTALLALESAAHACSVTLTGVAHFVVFSSLAIALWVLRPDMRGWHVVATLVLLAVASELMQGMTADRHMGTDDVVVNLMGAGAGLMLAAAGSSLRREPRDGRRRERKP